MPAAGDLHELGLNLTAMSTTELERSLQQLLTTGGATYNASFDQNLTVSDPRLVPARRQDPLEMMKRVWPPLLVTLGTVGNILAAAVLLRRRFRSISTSIFLLALAASDTVYLYFSNFTLIWLSQYAGLSPRLHADWSCRLIVYVFRSAADTSSWLVVAVTIERLLAVCLPFRAKGLCSRPRAFGVVLMIVVAMLVINSFTWFTYKVHSTYNNHEHQICYVDESLGPLTTLAIVLYDDMAYSFLPACIICVSNTAILVRMVKQARRTHKSRSKPGNANNKNTKDSGFTTEARRLTVMLVTVSCVFLISTLPICTISSYYAIMKYTGRKLPAAFNRPLSTLLLRVLMNSNHAFNFLLYCLSGPPFRHELYRMWFDACALCGRPRGRGHPGVAGESTAMRLRGDTEHNGDSMPMIEKTNEVAL